MIPEPLWSDERIDRALDRCRTENDDVLLLRQMRDEYEQHIAALQPAPPPAIDYTTPIVLIQRGESTE